MTFQPRPQPLGGDGCHVLHGVDRRAVRHGAGGELQAKTEGQSTLAVLSLQEISMISTKGRVAGSVT